MRRVITYIFSLAFLACILQLSAQNTRSIELSVDMDDFRIVASKEGHFMVETDRDSYYYPDDPDNPAIPVRNINILMPNGSQLENFSFSYEDEIIEQDIILKKLIPPIPFSVLDTWQAAEPGIYEGDFPREMVHFSGTRIQRGYTWFSFVFSPFRYDGTTRNLSLVKKLKLELEISLEADQTTIVRPEKEVLKALENNMINPEDIEQFYPGIHPQFLKSSEDPIDYLIITTEELKPGFEALLEWKTRKGLRTEVITLEEISSMYTEPNIQLKIKRCLHEYYSQRNLKWALLGGDQDVIPVQGCYTKIDLGREEYEEDSIPTDLFYACFDNRFDWNSTEDEKIGELYWDHHDILPEIYLSRIPVSDLEQVRTFVRKTLTYEMNPPWNEFSEGLLLSGIKAWNIWDGKSDSHHRSDYMFSQFIKKRWNGRKVGFFDTGTDHEEDHEFNVTASNLVAELNKGYGIFHYAGHGNRTTIPMESGKSFSLSEARQLTNPFPGLMMSTACLVNAFDSPGSCLSEAFLENPVGGAVAFFGSSRLGFGNSDQDARLGPSFGYSARFLKNLFQSDTEINGTSFAQVVAKTKTDFAYNGSCSGAYIYLLYSINPMGDPEIPLYTSTPSQLDNVRLYRMDDALTVNTGGIKECRICITSEDLDEGYHRVVEGVSNFTFDNIPERFQVTVTAPNFIPYRYYSGSATGIENNLNSRIRIYPNPATDFMNIEMDIPRAELQLFDMHGRLLLEQELTGAVSRIELSGFSEGTYLARFRTDEGIAWFKCIKR